MSILVYIEQAEGAIKKTSLEAISFAKALAEKEGSEVTAVALGTVDQSELAKAGSAGASKVLHVNDEKLNAGVIQAHASAVAQAFEKENAKTLVLAKSSLGDAVAARLAIRLNAGLVSNVTELPDTTNGYKVKRSIYTGKAFAETNLSTENKILAVKKNAIDLKTDGADAQVESFDVQLGDGEFAAKITSTDQADCGMRKLLGWIWSQGIVSTFLAGLFGAVLSASSPPMPPEGTNIKAPLCTAARSAAARSASSMSAPAESTTTPMRASKSATRCSFTAR
jgi:electron transfer flavoprotein alpha subunit